MARGDRNGGRATAELSGFNGLDKGTRCLLTSEAITRRVAEWLCRPEHADLVDKIRAIVDSVPKGLVTTPTAIRMTLLQYVGPLGVPEGDRVELLVILLESALWTVDWRLMAELIAPHAGTSPTPSPPDSTPTTNIGSS